MYPPPPQETQNWPTNCPYPPQGYPVGYVPQGGYYPVNQGFEPVQQSVPMVYPPPQMQQGYFPQQGFPVVQQNFMPHPAYTASGYQSALPPPEQHMTDAYIDTGNAKGFAFSDASIRRTFIRKVYSLLSIQLVITFSLVLLLSFHDGLKTYMRFNPWIVMIGIIILFAALITLTCCESVSRSYPTNLILLGLITLAEGICVGFLSSRYNPELVVIAMGMTAVMSIALTLFAIQTKWDFTKHSGALFVALLMFFIAGIVGCFIRSHIFGLILSCIGLTLFSIYLIHDTQLIIGGSHKYQLSPEEYIVGTLILYLDILRIFTYILRILAATSND